MTQSIICIVPNCKDNIFFPSMQYGFYARIPRTPEDKLIFYPQYYSQCSFLYVTLQYITTIIAVYFFDNRSKLLR